MVLHDISLPGLTGKKHIRIGGGIIRQIADSRNEIAALAGTHHLELDGCIALPGFINSHDHLDFNCYPLAGNRRYNNYTEWGRDIHQSHAGVIEQVKKIPEPLRIQWGLYKNLLGGFTTVVNHGKRLGTDDELVQVYQDYHLLHSPAFEKNWVWKLNRPFSGKRVFVMHIGEGTDAVAKAEIDRVIQKNFFRRKIVAVHGVAMEARQAASFEGLVWCPASNEFLLGTTAALEELKDKTNTVFGTDSTLTAPWETAAHFRSAMATGKVTEAELLAMLTANAAALWQLRDRGEIKEGMKADILVLRQTDSLFSGYTENLQLVICGGKINMSATVPADPGMYDRILLHGKRCYVKKGIRDLLSAIHDRYPDFSAPFSIEA